MIDHLNATVTDIITGAVNRHITAWENWQDQQDPHRHIFHPLAPGGGA